MKEAMIPPQSRDYSRQMDLWYARDVYRVGKAFLLFWLFAGLVGLGIFGLLAMCLALSAGPTADPMPAWVARDILAGVVVLTAGIGLICGLVSRQGVRYWALAILGAGGGLGLVFFLWRVGA